MFIDFDLCDSDVGVTLPLVTPPPLRNHSRYCRQTERQKDRMKERQTKREMGGAERPSDRGTESDSQGDIQTDRQTHGGSLAELQTERHIGS